MHRISSSLTWWHKRVFPTIWFGALGLFFVAGVIGVIHEAIPAPTLLIPLILAAFGYGLMRWLVFPLADEVWIEGDEIIVGNRGQEACFPIANIVDVEEWVMTNPNRIVLTLKEPCGIARQIVFSPPSRWWRRSRSIARAGACGRASSGWRTTAA